MDDEHPRQPTVNENTDCSIISGDMAARHGCDITSTHSGTINSITRCVSTTMSFIAHYGCTRPWCTEWRTKRASVVVWDESTATLGAPICLDDFLHLHQCLYGTSMSAAATLYDRDLASVN